MSFRNLILNQRCDPVAQFISAAAWKACGSPVADVAQLKGRPCYGGLDLAASKDLSALVLVFADEHGAFDVLPHCWLPSETLQEAQDRDRMPYVPWARDGHLLTFPGRTTDPKVIALKLPSCTVATISALLL